MAKNSLKNSRFIGRYQLKVIDQDGAISLFVIDTITGMVFELDRDDCESYKKVFGERNDHLMGRDPLWDILGD